MSQHSFWSKVVSSAGGESQLIGPFRVAVNFIMKVRLSAKFLL